MIRKIFKKVNPVTFALALTLFIFGALLGLIVFILNYTYAANITVYNGTILDIKVSLTQDYSNINVNITFLLSNGKTIEISEDYTCINYLKKYVLDKYHIGENSIIYKQRDQQYDIYDKKGFVKAFGYFSIISLGIGIILTICSFISCDKKTYVSV